MDILIRRATILDADSPFYRQTHDLFIQNGIIADIGNIDAKADKVVEAADLHVSAGWVDAFAHFCDPGQEYCETLETGAAAAAAGGYTDVLLVPDTKPPVHNKSAVEYIASRSRQLPVNLHPIGAVSKNLEGKELAEMYDMHQSGAQAFGDGWHSIQNSGLLLKALQYLKAIDKTIIQLPDENSIGGKGLMNEGVVSTQLGLPGKPAIAEELMILRDLELARYTGSRIHFTGVSTAQSLSLIKSAKEQGIQVTCSVTPHHLFFSDDDLRGYDTNLKVNPPLRTAEDRNALIEGIQNGIVDAIASHHLPRHIDQKVTEFEYAEIGIAGIETAFGVAHTVLHSLPLEKLVSFFTNARGLFGLPAVSIKKGQKASITLFQPREEWSVNRLRSRSANSPFTGKKLTGKPLGIISKDQLILNEL
ncbi:MAG: dihydroorotase [Flavisolibacter sp.]